MTLINIKTKHIGSMFIIDKFYVVYVECLSVQAQKDTKSFIHDGRRLTRVSREGTGLAEGRVFNYIGLQDQSSRF